MKIVGTLRCQYLARFEDDVFPLEAVNRVETLEQLKKTFGEAQMEGKLDDHKVIEEFIVRQASLELQDRGLLTIEQAQIGRRTIFVVVTGLTPDRGTTKDAKLVCQKLAETIFQKEGIWTELHQKISWEQFGTSCVAELNFPFHALLKKELWDFLSNNFKQAFQLPESKVVVFPRVVGTKVRLFPTVDDSNLSAIERAQRKATYDFGIEIGSFDDYKRNRLSFFSELSYDKHIELIKKLESMLAAEG